MKKFIFTCMMCIAFFSVSVCAGSIEYDETMTVEQFDGFSSDYSTLADTFAVTNGMEDDYESTFDLSRTISGFSAKDTAIDILVYAPQDAEDESAAELSLLSSYNISVGSSGIFSQTLDLSFGENYILVFAENQEGEALRKMILNRKDSEIKLELEQNIALPGNSLQ